MSSFLRGLTRRSMILLLLGSTLLTRTAAEYLPSPEFTNQFDTNEAMLQGNGITGSVDGRIFATTQAGNLWIFSPRNQGEPVVFTPTPWVDEETGDPLDVTCQSSVVLKETPSQDVLYAVYVVIDSTSNGQIVQSRVLGVNPNDGSLLWFFVLEESAAVGTPAIGQNLIYVIHNSVVDEAGSLTLINVSAANQASAVDSYTSPTAPWGPPSVANYPETDDTWQEAVVWGDSLDNGRSRSGSTHVLKVGAGTRVLQTLTDFTGSTITAPALGRITEAGNDRYAWSIATGNYNGLIHVWSAENSNVGDALSSPDPVDPSFEPTWQESATSFTSGQFPMQVSPVFSALDTFIFVAGAEGGLSAWGAARGRQQWEIPTLVHVSQPIVYVPTTASNNIPTMLYACDARGTIRQIEANNRGGLNWLANYCEENGLISCPGVSANMYVSRDGNQLFVGNEQGSIFEARIATFDTPALSTDAPTTVPTIGPTSLPTIVVVDVEAGAPSATGEDKPGKNDQGEDEDGNGGDEQGGQAENNDEDGDEKPDPAQPLATSAPSSAPVIDSVASSGQKAIESDSGSSSNGLYVVLGVVIFALCLCVGGAAIVLKRRRKNKQTRDREIKEEMAAVHRWKSSKKMYEQEMRDEEEATMQELSKDSPRRSVSTDDTAESSKPDAFVTPPQNDKRAGSRSRSNSRTRGQSSTPGTLGSISESVDEEIGSTPEAEAGVEVEVVDTDDHSSEPLSRNLAVAFASDEVAKKAETAQERRADSPAEAVLNEDDPVKGDPKGTTSSETSSGSKDSSLQRLKNQSRAEASKEVGDKGESAKAETTRLLESKSLYSSHSHDDDKSDINSEISGKTEEPGQIRPYVPPPSTSPPSIHTTLSTDDDKSDMTSILSGLSAQSQNTDEPGAIKSSPKKIHYLPGSPCASDLLSVDSSIYLDDSTAATPAPPAQPSPIDHPVVTPPRATLPRKALEPPEGASVVGSPVSSAASGGSSEQAGSTPGVMMPALSIASDETTKRSNSKERTTNYSSTKVHSRMFASKQSLHTKPGVIEGNPQGRGRMRAGLFSRRQQQQIENSSQSNISSDMSYSQWSESVSAASSGNEAMKIVGKASGSAAPSRVPSTVPAVATGNQKQSKSKTKKSKSEKGQGTEDNPWNSFLNQLAKVEEEFFNPTLPAKAAPTPKVQKAQRQFGRKRSGKPSFPPPLPPPSHTDVYFGKKKGNDGM